MNKHGIQNLQTFYKNYSPISSKYSSTYYSFAYTFLFHLIKHAHSKLNILFTMTPLQMLYDKMVLRTNCNKTLQNYKQNSLQFSTNYRKKLILANLQYCCFQLISIHNFILIKVNLKQLLEAAYFQPKFNDIYNM